MITPALDLQAAPQMVDGVGPRAAQPDGSGDSGDFGAAFTASLSSSSPTPVTSDSETTGTQTSPQQKSLSVHNTSDRSVPAQNSTVSSSVTTTSVKLPVRATALTVLNAAAKHSSVDALSEALASVTSETATALTDSANAVAAAQTPSKPNEPVNAAVADPQLALNKDASIDGKAGAVAMTNLAERQGSLVSASRPLTSQVSETSRAASVGKVSEVAGKSKATTHDSQASVVGTVKGDPLLASLGTSAPVFTAAPIAITMASTKETSVEAVNGSKAQLASAGQDPGTSATLLSITTAAASRSNLPTAWNSIEIAAHSARNAVATENAAGTEHSELVYPVGLSGRYVGTVAAPGASVGLASVDRLSTPPIHWPTSPVATDVAQSSEATASPASASLPIVTGVDLHTNALSASLSPASSANTAEAATSVATHTLSSSVPSKPQTASVELLASRSLNAAGQVKNTTAGVLASATHAADGTAQSAWTRAIGAAANSASSVQADTKAAPIGNQPKEVATTAVAFAGEPTKIKQTAVQADRASSSHPSIAAAGTDALSSSHRGALDDSAVTPDRGTGSDANSTVVAVHGDSSAAVISQHTNLTPTLDLSNGSVAAIANSAATVAHQISTGATNLSAATATGAVGTSAVQTAGTEALHGASSLSSQPHQTLAATPTSLEVGVHSGTQGWLKIRAEVGDQGDVTASLAATSTSGQQSLKGQLPALNAYLQSEQMSVTASVAERIGVTHVAVAHDTSLGSSAAGTGSAGQDTSLLQSGAGQGAFSQGGGHQGSGLNPASGSTDPSREEALQTYASRVEPGGSAPTTAATDGSGRWLNVRV